MQSMVLAKPKYIKKHNAAIRSFSEMTLLQRKLANALLYNAYHELDNKHFHEISIPELLSLLCMKTNDYGKLKQAILKLLSTVIEWDVIKKINENNLMDTSNIDGWNACTMLSSVQIKGTVIRYEYSQLLRKQLYKPSVYSKINLNIQNKFRSLYALSLYENCLSYVNCGSSGWITLEIFRRLMGVNELQYKTFRDFNKRVLKPAILEVNASSDLEVKCEIRRVLRKPSHLRLIVSNKINETNQIISGPENYGLIESKLLNYGFSKKDARETLEKFTSELILEKMNLIDSSKTKINSPIAFLKAALRDDYKKNILVAKNSNADYLKSKEEEQQKALLKNKYQQHVDKVYREWLSNLNEREKMFLIENVKNYCENSRFTIYKRAKSKLQNKNWINDSDVFLSIKTFISSQEGKITFNLNFPKIISIEEYTNLAKKQC